MFMIGRILFFLMLVILLMIVVMVIRHGEWGYDPTPQQASETQ